MLYDNKYSLLEWSKSDAINERIHAEIKAWGSQDNFFADLGYSKQAFHKCRREHKAPPLEVLCLIADRLNCDVGYLLCEYDDRRHSIVDIKKETGLDAESIQILLNMNKNNSMKILQTFNDLLKDDYFLAILKWLARTDNFFNQAQEMNATENSLKTTFDSTESEKQKRKIEKEYDACRQTHKQADNEVIKGKYTLQEAFSRFLDNKYGTLPDLESIPRAEPTNHIFF
jgi:hypothetical protein